MTVIGLQDFISAAIARQVKPATLRASANVQLPASTGSTAPLETASSLSTISSQSAGSASYASTSGNLAQLGTVLQLSQSGVQNIQSILQQLEALAGQANSSPDVSTATLAKINSQFQQLLAQINRIAAGTTFGDSSLLDGTFSGQQLASANVQGAAPKISLPNVTQEALFNSNEPNLLTPEAAAKALTLLSNAKDTADKASADISDASDQVKYASASVQTAITNIDASTALLTDADVEGVLETILGGLLAEPAASANVQTANLSPSLLALIQE